MGYFIKDKGIISIVIKFLKDDKYRKKRGAWSRLVDILCEKCGDTICLYQKDGPGSLRRMYLDRIINPKVSISRKHLSCANGHLLGVKIIWKKEKRPAFRMFVESVTKKLRNSKSPRLF